MAEGGISIQNPETVSSSPKGSFTVASKSGEFTIHHATDHNEISIMKSDWDEICRKANAIKLHQKFDWIGLLWGAAIPYCIEAIKSSHSGTAVDFFPLAVCFFLIAVFKSFKLPNLFKRKVKITIEPLDAECEFANFIHHEDLLKTLDRITTNLKSADSTQSTDVTTH